MSANQKDAAFDLINSISVAYDSSESFSNEFSATIYITGSDKRELRALMLTLLDLVSDETIEKHLSIISIKYENYMRLIDQFKKTLENKRDDLARQKYLEFDDAINLLTENAQIARRLNIITPSDSNIQMPLKMPGIMQDYHMFLMGYEALELLIETIKEREDFDPNYVDPSLVDIQNELAFHQENRRVLKNTNR